MIDLKKKATMATVKAFIRTSGKALMIDSESSFDGMCDGVRQNPDRGFTLTLPGNFPANDLGVQGAWFVGSSRDFIQPFVKDGIEGYRISNCCGSFALAVAVPK
jgi:hypothetical protein